ncbi:MAG: hypothetical protein AAFO94_10375 [Bacteroidota bacterium]
MKTLLIFLFSCMLIVPAASQSMDKTFQKAYKRISDKKIFELDRTNAETRRQDSLEVVEMNQLLTVLNNFSQEQHRMNGSAGFTFSGNESELSNLYRVGVTGSMDGGAYPYEVDFSINVQTTIQNGNFQESLSDIDVSFDFHPIIPDEFKKKEKKLKDGTVITRVPDGLWMESYVFLKRFNNNFLGIQQRYEAGAGFVLNLYSTGLTEKGKTNLKQLEKIPKYDIYGSDLRRCLEECYLKKSVLQTTGPAEICNTSFYWIV